MFITNLCSLKDVLKTVWNATFIVIVKLKFLILCSITNRDDKGVYFYIQIITQFFKRKIRLSCSKNKGYTSYSLFNIWQLVKYHKKLSLGNSTSTFISAQSLTSSDNSYHYLNKNGIQFYRSLVTISNDHVKFESERTRR